MAGVTDRSHHLFIVRLWHEPGQAATSPWRGSVEHVPSGQRLYFVSLSDLSDFIALRLGGDTLLNFESRD